MEKLAYLIKHRFPALFQVVAWLAERVTGLRYGHRTAQAIEGARIEGLVNGERTVIRALAEEDVEHIHEFLGSLPAEHLHFFRPHGFDRRSLVEVLGSKAYLNYGLFVKGEIIGYALLKISPTGSAFIGLLVRPDYGGLGLGTFIVDYLYWQASLAGLRTRSTISRANPASLRSHQAVVDFEVVAELPNGYLMIEFPKVSRQKPELNLS